MKVYVAGPMTGLPDLNFPAFHHAAGALRELGFTTSNPAEINADKAADWATCLRADIRELVTCDAIYLLAGHERSRGASLELHIAVQLGMAIIHDERPLKGVA